MRLAFTLSLCTLLSISPALAAPSTDAAPGLPVAAAAAGTCGWSAAMEEDEGGPIMVASSCDSDTDTGPVLRLYCGNIRYNGNGLGMGDTPPTSSTLVLTTGGKSLTANVRFEEMDGAFAADVELGGPIVTLLKTGDAVGVTLKGTNLPPRMVSLRGSSAAIDKLIGACK